VEPPGSRNLIIGPERWHHLQGQKQLHHTPWSADHTLGMPIERCAQIRTMHHPSIHVVLCVGIHNKTPKKKQQALILRLALTSDCIHPLPLTGRPSEYNNLNEHARGSDPGSETRAAHRLNNPMHVSASLVRLACETMHASSSALESVQPMEVDRSSGLTFTFHRPVGLRKGKQAAVLRERERERRRRRLCTDSTVSSPHARSLAVTTHWPAERADKWGGDAQHAAHGSSLER
jgi:hypothetical protein